MTFADGLRGQAINLYFWLREFVKWRLLYQPRHYRKERFRFDTGGSMEMNSHQRILLIRMNHSYAGFFAYFTFAINQILFCERNGFVPVVYFGPWSGDGPNAYYDEARGHNMWEYYFEPVSEYSYGDVQGFLASPDHPLQAVGVLSLDDDDLWYLHTREKRSVFAYTYGRHLLKTRNDPNWYNEQRRTAYRVIQEYIRIKPWVQARVDSIFEKNLAGDKVLGVHLRGTDKGAALTSVNTRKKVRPERYIPEIDRYLSRHPGARIFVATDQKQYLEHLCGRYGKRIFSTECLRSEGDLAPFQLSEGSGFDKGAEVLIDALLLSRCDFLLKSASHVSESALWFNPDIPSLDLSYEL